MIENESGLEGITVRIGEGVPMTYGGLGGTFASFAFNCIEKKVLPGFYEAGLVEAVELDEKRLTLRLSGKKTLDEWRDVMDIALVNIGAVQVNEGKGGYFIKVETTEKGR